MAEPFLGEIRLMSFREPPKGWALCNGQLLPINQNQALFALLGTAYGGNGQTTFALPDLRGRVPVHVRQGQMRGIAGGANSHTLSSAEMPSHTHLLTGSSGNADTSLPGGNVVGQSSQLYGPPAQLVGLDASTSGVVGGSQPHENRQPYLVLSFCMALQGIFPSPN